MGSQAFLMEMIRNGGVPHNHAWQSELDREDRFGFVYLMVMEVFSGKSWSEIEDHPKLTERIQRMTKWESKFFRHAESLEKYESLIFEKIEDIKCRRNPTESGLLQPAN